MISRYRMFAGYNAWCNERLYAAAAKLSDADYRADRGAFFKSVHGTLNHLAGRRPHLDAALHRQRRGAEEPRCHPLRRFRELARGAPHEDARISRYIERLSDDDLAGTIRFRTFINPADIEQVLSPALDHFFNHQTHHRGQAHALLSSIIGNDATPSFDLIIYQRETGQGGLRMLG